MNIYDNYSLRNEIEQYRNSNGFNGRSSPKKSQNEIDVIELTQSLDTTKKSLHRAGHRKRKIVCLCYFFCCFRFDCDEEVGLNFWLT